jgi:lactobin A/cerein 7B family class IIb bacteriocin
MEPVDMQELEAVQGGLLPLALIAGCFLLGMAVALH